MRSSALLSAMALAVSTLAAAPALAQTQDRNVCYFYQESPIALRLNIQSHSRLSFPTADAPAQFTYSVAGKFVDNDGRVAPVFGSVLLGAEGAGANMLLNVGTATPLTLTCTTPSSSAIPASWNCGAIQVEPATGFNPSPARIYISPIVSFPRANPSTQPLCDAFASPD